MAVCPLSSKVRPATDVAERLEFAELCLLKRLFIPAVRFFADAFAAEPGVGG